MALLFISSVYATGERGTVPEPAGYISSRPMDKLARAGVPGGVPEVSYIKARLSPGDNIQAAMNDGGPGVVYLRTGTYTLTSPLYMRKGVVLRGASRNDVILSVKFRSTSRKYAIQFNANNGCSFAGLENLTVSYDAVPEWPIDRSALDDGGYYWAAYQNNPYGYTDLYVSLVLFNGDNNWMDSVNLKKSGTDPVRITGSHNTVRNSYIDHCYNKGDGGNGYFDIQGDYNLVADNWIRRIRHFAVQQGAQYNVVRNNTIEVDVNFHNGDGGNNLVEYNQVYRPSWHPWVCYGSGAPEYGHEPPGPGNMIFRNTSWDYALNYAPLNTWNATYTYWDYGSPGGTDWNVPPKGKYYSTKYLDSPWSGADIGGNGQAGFASYSDWTWTIKADGADVWDRADDFYYAWQPLHGDGEIVVQVKSQPWANEWAKAGVMIREDLEAGSKHAMICVTPAHGTSFQYRKFSDAISYSVTPEDGQRAPAWLKLRRRGSTITGYVLRNDEWVQVGSTTISMWAEAYVGLFVSSHNAWSQTEVQFYHQAVLPLLTVDQPVVTPGASFQVDFGQAPGYATDWIGLYRKGDVPGEVAARSWKYLNNTQTAGYIHQRGSVSIPTSTSLDPGEYFIALFKNGTFEQVGDAVSVSVFVDPPSLSLSKSVFMQGETIRVGFDNAPGNATDWIGIYQEENTPSEDAPLDWKYLNNSTNTGSIVTAGFVEFDSSGWPPGNYFATLCENGTSNQVANPATFAVYFESEEGEPPAPSENGIVLIDSATRNGSFEWLNGTFSYAKATHWDTDPDGDVDNWTLWDSAVGGPSTAGNDSGTETNAAIASDGLRVGFLQPGNAVFNLTGHAAADGDTFIGSWKWVREQRGILLGQLGYQDETNNIVPIEGTEFGGAELRTFWRTWTVPAGHPCIGHPIAITLRTVDQWAAVDEVVLFVEPAPVLDGDEDGMDDAWELAYFGNLDRDGTGDADGDGTLDLYEWLIGLNPTNSTEKFAAEAGSYNPSNTFSIVWPGKSGLSFSIERNTNLLDGTWSQIQSIIADHDGVQTNVDTSLPAGDNAYYRVLLNH